MLIAIAIAFCLCLVVTLAFVPVMMNSGQISREEEVKEVIYNKTLTFKNKIIIDAEFEDCLDNLPVVQQPSSGIVRIMSSYDLDNFPVVYKPSSGTVRVSAYSPPSARKVNLFV